MDIFEGQSQKNITKVKQNLQIVRIQAFATRFEVPLPILVTSLRLG